MTPALKYVRKRKWSGTRCLTMPEPIDVNFISSKDKFEGALLAAEMVGSQGDKYISQDKLVIAACTMLSLVFSEACKGLPKSLHGISKKAFLGLVRGLLEYMFSREKEVDNARTQRNH